jgi:hypothetical protein
MSYLWGLDYYACMYAYKDHKNYKYCYQTLNVRELEISLNVKFIKTLSYTLITAQNWETSNASHANNC